MKTSRTIAILGACNKNGRIAAYKLITHNRLLLIDEDREQLRLLKNELLAKYMESDVEVIECYEDMGWEADAVLLALQTSKDNEIFSLMKPYVTGKTVIIFSCGKEDDLDRLLPHSKVIRINEADCNCVDKMESILSNAI